MNRDCENCGAPIPPARLVAVPDATRCVDCQAKSEDTLAAAAERDDVVIIRGGRVGRPTRVRTDSRERVMAQKIRDDRRNRRDLFS